MASGICVARVEQVGDSEDVRRRGEARFQAGPSNWGQDEAVGPDHLSEVEDWSIGISWNMIAQKMEGIEVSADNVEGVEGNIRVIELDMENAASKIGRLRKTAILLQALESSSSRDHVVSWIRETTVIKHSVGISQVKELSRKEFLIVFASEADKRRVLGNAPSFLDGKLMIFFEWAEKDLVKQSAHLRAAWVEQKGVPSHTESF
ncbi:hypothetical protein R1sor_009067 [Riccia sorocarpa]|uniref:DUF4283 domain-containing protein n=1 Tax=Riccia sorocarpa TaxID=122646 RepID=A0ABD3H4Q6_9MARC